MMFSLLVNATFSTVAMVIHIDAAVPNTKLPHVVSTLCIV